MTPFSTDYKNDTLFNQLDWKYPNPVDVLRGPPHDIEHGTPFNFIAKLSAEGRSVAAHTVTGYTYVYFAGEPIWQAWRDSAVMLHAGEWFAENVRWNTLTAYARLGRQQTTAYNSLAVQVI